MSKSVYLQSEVTVGKKFGKLTILSLDKIVKNNKIRPIANCICDCGNLKTTEVRHICTAEVTTCGCSKFKAKNDILDNVNQKFNRLTIIDAIQDKNQRWLAVTKCDCGNITHNRMSHLRENKIQSCGCLHSENLSKANREFENAEDAVGLTFNRLTVTKAKYELDEKLNVYQVVVDASCICGKLVKNKKFSDLKNGGLKSCGCAKSKETYNYNFFKEYSPERNYILGLLATDGCMVSNKCTVQLELQERDKSILEKISMLLIGRVKLTSRRPLKGTQDAYLLRIHNTDIYNDLLKLGLYPDKTKTYTVPDELKYCAHFWRGCIDGDGHISVSTKKHHKIVIGICGTRSICQGFKDFINYNEIIENNKVYSDKNCKSSFEFMHHRIAGLKGLEVAKILYKDKGDFFIERKFNNYIEALNKELKLNDSKNNRS